MDPFPATTKEMNFSEYIPMNRMDSFFYLVQPLQRFDALWYNQIAYVGYSGDERLAAFFPLFPYLIKFIGIIFHLSFPLASWFVTTIIAIGIFWVFYVITRLDESEVTATRTIILFALFPTSFFLLAPYADGLLILFVLLTFLSLKLKKIWLAIVFAGIAVVTKPYGVLILVPIVIYFFQFYHDWKHKLITVIPLSVLFSIFIMVIRFIDHSIGITGATFTVQSLWGVNVFTYPLLPIGAEILTFFRYPFDLVNDLNIVCMVGSLWLLWRFRSKIPVGYWWFVIANIITFYFLGFKGTVWFSISRYSLVLFPLFIVISRIKIPETRWVMVISMSSLCLVVLFTYYILGFFVG